MKSFFENKFRFYTPKMNRICLHCHWLYFSSILLDNVLNQKSFFYHKFKFYTSKLDEICLHCHWLYFSSIILGFGQCDRVWLSCLFFLFSRYFSRTMIVTLEDQTVCTTIKKNQFSSYFLPFIETIKKSQVEKSFFCSCQ